MFSHLVQFVAKSKLRPLLLEHLHKFEHGGNDLRVVLQTLLGQFDGDFEFSEAKADRMLTNLQISRQVLALQVRQD